jgi:hypothetical protein
MALVGRGRTRMICDSRPYRIGRAWGNRASETAAAGRCPAPARVKIGSREGSGLFRLAHLFRCRLGMVDESAMTNAGGGAGWTNNHRFPNDVICPCSLV